MSGAELRQVILANDLATLQQELPLEPTLIDWTDEDGIALSFLAARHGNLAMLQYLVEYGLRVNLNTYDPHGRDLLHHAAMSGVVEKCRYLVERGGMDALRGDVERESPFDIAHRMGHADLEAYFETVVGAKWEDTYHNPIRTGFFPDPPIVRVGEDYYMVNSTFIFFPCIPISHSRDLVNWRVISHAIEKAEWACVDELMGGRGWWAPDISFSNGRFYITATRRLSETTLLYYGSQKRAPEGPHLLKKDGWYYLFEAEGGTGIGHRETVSRSRTLHGVYTPSPYSPVIRQWDERAIIQRCGHAKPVSTPDGRWYFVYLCGRALDGKWTMLGRETALDPFTWTADGWPLFNGGKGPSTQNIRPLPEVKLPETEDWLTPRPPEEGQITWNGDKLHIRGSDFPMTDVRC